MAESIKCKCSGGRIGCFTEILAFIIIYWILWFGGSGAIMEWTRQHTPPPKVEQKADDPKPQEGA